MWPTPGQMSRKSGQPDRLRAGVRWAPDQNWPTFAGFGPDRYGRIRVNFGRKIRRQRRSHLPRAACQHRQRGDARDARPDRRMASAPRAARRPRGRSRRAATCRTPRRRSAGPGAGVTVEGRQASRCRRAGTRRLPWCRGGTRDAAWRVSGRCRVALMQRLLWLFFQSPRSTYAESVAGFASRIGKLGAVNVTAKVHTIRVAPNTPQEIMSWHFLVLFWWGNGQSNSNDHPCERGAFCSSCGSEIADEVHRFSSTARVASAGGVPKREASFIDRRVPIHRFSTTAEREKRVARCASALLLGWALHAQRVDDI